MCGSSLAFVLGPPPGCQYTYIIIRIRDFDQEREHYVKVTLSEVNSVITTLQRKPFSIKEAVRQFGLDIRPLMRAESRAYEVTEGFSMDNYEVFDFGQHLFCFSPVKYEYKGWYKIPREQPVQLGFGESVLQLIGLGSPPTVSRFFEYHETTVKLHNLSFGHLRKVIEDSTQICVFVPALNSSAKEVVYRDSVGDYYVPNQRRAANGDPVDKTPIFLYSDYQRSSHADTLPYCPYTEYEMLRFHGGELMFMYDAYGKKSNPRPLCQIGNKVLVSFVEKGSEFFDLVELDALPLWSFTAGVKLFRVVDMAYSPEFLENHYPRIVYSMGSRDTAIVFLLNYSLQQDRRVIIVDSYEVKGVESLAALKSMLVEAPCLVGDECIVFGRSNKVAFKVIKRTFRCVVGPFIYFDGFFNCFATDRCRLWFPFSDSKYQALYDDQVTVVAAAADDRCTWFNIGGFWMNPCTRKFLDQGGNEKTVTVTPCTGSSHNQCWMTDRHAVFVRRSESGAWDVASLSIFPDTTNLACVTLWLMYGIATSHMEFKPMNDKLANVLEPTVPSAPSLEEPPQSKLLVPDKL